MQKGKFGFSLWIYPFLALWAASTRVFWVPFLIAGVVLMVEKEEWAIKQCLHTLVITLLYSTYHLIMAPLAQIPNSTDIGSMLSSGNSPIQWGSIFSTIDIVVSIAFFVLMVMMGMLRLIKGENISFWGMGIVNRAYGFIQQTVTIPAPAQPPYTPPTPPAPAPPQYTQPAPPPYAPPAPPAPVPPQYTQPTPPPYIPPASVPPQYTQPTPPTYAPPAPAPQQTPPPPPPPAPSVHGGFVPPPAPPSGVLVPPSVPPAAPPQPNEEWV